MNIVYALASGLLLALAFPKFNLSFLCWIALVPFFYSLYNAKKPSESAFLSFIFGLTFFGINLFWVNTLSNYVGFFAFLGWICLVIFQSVFIMVYGWLIKYFKLELSIWQAIIWVLFEILRGMGPLGVGAGVLAYSQTGFLPLIQAASVASVFGVSFLIVLFNAAFTRVIVKKDFSLIASTIVLILITVVFGAHELSINQNNSKSLKIAVIQANIPQEKKLSSLYNNEIFEINKSLSLKAAKDSPKIIIWPETTILTYLLNDNYYLPQIKDLARVTNAFIIIGTPYYSSQNKIFNSVVVISPRGEVICRYDKQHLVPFGEYLPIRSLTYPLLKYANYFSNDFSEGESIKPLIVDGVKFGTVVCFESTFPKIFNQMVRNKADILLVVTNDAWFKDSAAPYEHFNNGIFRAIENRKYFIQAANTGISGLIDPYGRIVKKLGLNQTGYLTFEVPLP